MDQKDPRYYLVKAQETEAMADASHNPEERTKWEAIAAEYRRMAKLAGEQVKE